MNQDALRQAFKLRKGNGVDIHIMLGDPKNQENEKTDLAPDLEKDEQVMEGTADDLDLSNMDKMQGDSMVECSPEEAKMSPMKKMLMGGAMGKRGLFNRGK